MKQCVFFLFLIWNLQVKANSAAYGSTQDLKILSWNIHMLPSVIYHKTKKKKRAKQIIQHLNSSEFNILVLQEAFHKGIRRRMRKGLKEKFPFDYGPANRRRFSLRTNSGIWILSDRPLLELTELKFKECVGDGCLARKGVLMVEGEHNGNRFQLLGTHNNGGWVNNSQFHQMRSELLDPYRKEGVPQLICGDFNTKLGSPNNQWQTMLRLFDIDDTYQQQDDRSDEHKAAWPIESVYKQWPDFIFVRPNECETLQVKRISTISIGPTWYQGDPKIYLKTVGLSDHYPVKIELNWE